MAGIIVPKRAWSGSAENWSISSVVFCPNLPLLHFSSVTVLSHGYQGLSQFSGKMCGGCDKMDLAKCAAKPAWSAIKQKGRDTLLVSRLVHCTSSSERRDLYPGALNPI
jgi:hypothetical protein